MTIWRANEELQTAPDRRAASAAAGGEKREKAGEKVGAGNVCLWCNEKGRSFYSAEAVQSHMTDKSHCKLFTDGDAALEFADFYDFRDERLVKLVAADGNIRIRASEGNRKTFILNPSFSLPNRSSYPDKKEGEDAEMDEEELPDDKSLEYDDDTLELTLPSGAKIGHRSLMRYYKQRFGAQRAVVLAHNRNAVGRVLRQYKALGWGGDGALAANAPSPLWRYLADGTSRNEASEDVREREGTKSDSVTRCRDFRSHRVTQPETREAFFTAREQQQLPSETERHAVRTDDEVKVDAEEVTEIEFIGSSRTRNPHFQLSDVSVMLLQLCGESRSTLNQIDIDFLDRT
ncbi:Zinc finger protein 622 [Collichthys lucidus]|uniref:Zinc finger protein 622 n=1 Tax=Collichthys lucidus TaxID=240159 RepID=A0A4U5UVP0_COLLU|nr:Zinc finger protein 622 [Collichthys lucidus]